MPRRLLRAMTLLLMLASLSVPAQAARILLLIDNSGSMRANDAGRLVPTAVENFVASLPASTQVGVVAFDQRARLLAPMQPAADFEVGTLRSLDYSGQLTDPAAAVERALYAFRQAGAPADTAGRDAIVLLTDGVVDLGSAELNQRSEDWLLGELQASLVDEGISVWAVALTGAADFRILYRLTDATGGSYFRADDAGAVLQVSRTIREQILTPRRPATETVVTAAAPAVTQTPNAVPVPRSVPTVTTTPAAPQDDGDGLLWAVALLLLGSGVGLLVWVGWRTLYADVAEEAGAPEPLEYFPECYLVDLQGVTDHPTHALAGKYNMITRLQHPPEDGMNYIQIFRRQIGRRHALIEYRDFSFWVVDQNSVNGTFLNGRRVTEETRLKHGDRLRFHIYEFEFCVSDLALSNETLTQEQTAIARG